MTRPCLTLTLLLLPLNTVMAQSPAPVQQAATQAPGGADTRSIYDKIWQQFTTIYDNRSNSVVQRVLLSGRFQHEFAAIDADQGDHDEWNTRRFRIGPRITLFQTFTVAAEAELNPQEMDPLYMRLTDVYLQWSRSGRLAVTVGKQGIPYTMDGATSSKELITIDRSNLTNNIWFPQEYLPGASVSGRIAPWTYRVGMYSAGEANKEFGKFDGGVATLAVLGYDFAKRLGVKEALLAGSRDNPVVWSVARFRMRTTTAGALTATRYEGPSSRPRPNTRRRRWRDRSCRRIALRSESSACGRRGSNWRRNTPRGTRRLAR